MEAYKTYTERVIQPQPTILGLRLKPFTLGHAMLLKTAKSVFMLGGIETLTDRQMMGELIFALFICSTTYDEFLEEANTATFKDDVAAYVDKLTKEVSKTELFNLYSKVNMFANYIKTGTSTPYYYIAKGSESDLSVNPVEIEQSMLATLMADCNYTRSECLNLPLTETLSAYLLYAHKQGSVSLQGRDEFELLQKLKGTK